MALQIRRGTNKERLQITPAEGELIYVTDYELATISGTAINATTNVITSVAHGLTTNQQIRFQDTTKNGLTLNQVYYVASTPDPDNFTLKVSLAGAVVDITGTYTTPLVFATGPTNAAGAPTGINVTALWIGDGNTVGGVPGNTQGLDDLTDVQITTPAEGNTLYYDATTKQWKNTNILNIDDVTGTQNITVNGTGTSHIRAQNTNTNLGYPVLEVVSKTTATPVNGFGGAIKFTANNAVGTEKDLGYINYNFDDITTGSEDAGISIGLMENGVSPFTPPGTVPTQLKIRSNGDLEVRNDLYVGGGDITTAAGGIANLYNNNAVGTINIGNSVVTEVNIGNASGSRVQIKSPTIVGATASMDVFNTVATTVNAFGAATALTLGATTGTTTIRNNAVVTGNLTVNGTTTTVNSTTMTVDDKNIELASTATPSDALADGGGITLKGTTDKKIFWSNSNDRWYYDSGDGASNIFVRDLTDLTNVETTNFVKGQMFFFDGTNWVNGVNIKFDNATYRPTLTTQANVDTNGQPSTGGINTALRLVKDTTSVAFTDGAGTGLIMAVDSDSQDRIDVGRLHAQYDAGGAHDITLLTTTTNNDTYAELYRASKDRTNINNGVLYVNATNGRVGINTVSPNLSLEVQGNAYVSTTLEVVQDITGRSNVNVGGETITMNYGFTGAPSQDVAIVVERGDQPDAHWRWTENGDYWNTNYSIIADGSITAVGALGTNGLNIYFNNDDATPALNDNANLVVKRGGGNDIVLRWNEADDRWQFTNDGSTYTNMPVATDTPTYAGLNTTTGNVNVNNKTYLYGNTGDIRIGNDVYIGGDMLRFNEAQTGEPTLSANIVAERGNQPDVTFRWNEGNLRWESTVDGSAYIALPNQSLDQASSPTFSSLQANAHLSVLGNATLGSGTEDTITMNGLVAGNISFTFNDTATPRGILGKTSTGAEDFWFVGGAEASGTLNAGYLMLATGDDGTEPIYVRQYTGSPLSGTISKQLTLLDSSGNTTIPGTLEIDGNIIKASDGATALTLTPSNGNVTVEGDLFIKGNDLYGLGGYHRLNFPADTTNVKVMGDLESVGTLTITGNTIKKSSGTDVITFSGTNLTTFAGDIKLMGDSVYSSTGYRMFDYRETASIYGTSYQVKMNADRNIGLGASYLYLDNMVEMNTSSLTTTQNSTYAVLDYFDPATYRSAKYIVQITNGTTHQMWEGMVIHDGTNIFISAYGDLRTNGNLATMSVGFNATTGYPELRVLPVNATQTKFKATKTYIAV